METIKIKEEFLNQAALLARGAEVLPGGVEELALKLQKSKEEKCTYADKYTQTPWRRIPVSNTRFYPLFLSFSILMFCSIFLL